MITLLVFFGLLFAGLPIAGTILVAAIVFMATSDLAVLYDSIPIQFYGALEINGLLAIPLFLLVGESMNKGGLTQRLVAVAEVLVGSSKDPIEDFSHCHAGIRKKLDLLGELPALLAPVARAREVAAQAVEFFREAIFEHHLDEEREFFPAVLASARQGEEHDKVQAMVRQLTDEHRQLEATWKRLESGLRKLAKGQPADVGVVDIEALVTRYRARAAFEEQAFLPLSQTTLGRNSHHLAALGLSLHMRHTNLPVRGYV